MSQTGAQSSANLKGKQSPTQTASQSRLLSSFFASGFAEVLTLPLDLAKTRLQTTRRSSGNAGAPRGLVGTIVSIARQEGPRALWKGLAPALLRQTCYTSLSMVLYEPLRDVVSGLSLTPSSKQQLSFADRLLAGGSAGAMAIFVFNWAEVIKVQIQVCPTRLSIVKAFQQVYNSRGLLGFWAGVKPNVARTFVVNAAELGSYDQLKTEVFVPLVGNTFWAHLGASGTAGVISASVSTPVDVVKTRLMSEANQQVTGSTQTGMIRRGARILSEEGILALYSGFVPICVRKVCWCAAFFCSYELLLPVFAPA